MPVIWLKPGTSQTSDLVLSDDQRMSSTYVQLTNACLGTQQKYNTYFMLCEGQLNYSLVIGSSSITIVPLFSVPAQPKNKTSKRRVTMCVHSIRHLHAGVPYPLLVTLQTMSSLFTCLLTSQSSTGSYVELHCSVSWMTNCVCHN